MLGVDAVAGNAQCLASELNRSVSFRVEMVGTEVMRKRIVVGMVAMIALLVAVGGGWYWWTEGRWHESTDDAYVQSDISVISPKVAGYLKDLPVAENAQVPAGTVLAVIDPTEFRQKVEEAQANVVAQQAAVARIDSQIELQRAMIAQAEASVGSARAELTRTAGDVARYGKLIDRGYVTRQRFEAANADRQKADAALKSALAAATASHDQIAVLQTQRKEAEAQIERARAAVALAQTDLDNTVVRAPVDGVVGNRGAQLGQYVRAGTQLMSVVPLSDVYVVANFKETQIGHMRPGQPVEVDVDAFPDHALRGRIESFAPASGSQFSLLPPENATGNFTKIVQRVPVRIRIENGDPLAGMLRPGLSVVVSVDTRAEGMAMTPTGTASLSPFAKAYAADAR
jgi:membrane fusion protein (multidrug efflux system)